MKKLLLLLIGAGFFLSSRAQAPANDECDGAVLLTVSADNTCANLYTAAVSGATQSLAPCTTTGNPSPDVWYRFVASAATQTIALYPDNASDYALQVFSGTCGSLTSMACVNNTLASETEGSTLSGFVAGTTYYIRVYNREGTSGMAFRLCVNASTTFIANDEVSGAIARQTNGAGADDKFSTIGATLSRLACTGTATKDIWFKFVATSSRHRFKYKTTGPVNHPLAIEFFSGPPVPANLYNFGCYGQYDQIAEYSGFTPGVTFYYRIYASDGSDVSTDISTTVTTPPPGPSNDECADAIQLNVSSGTSCDQSLYANISQATQSLPSCLPGSTPAYDVWYKFVATSTTHTLTLSPVNTPDYAFQVYKGTCGALTSIACVNNTTYGETEGTTLTGLTPGNTYYIRVYTTNGASGGQFTFCVNSRTSFILNDEATGAIDIPTTGVIGSFSTLGATVSMPACAGTTSKDIWFKFMATSIKHSINFYAGGFDDYRIGIEVFTGTPGNFTQKFCTLADYFSESVDLTGLVAGTYYYYRLYVGDGHQATTNIKTSIVTPYITGPYNDECFNALPLTVNPGLENTIRESVNVSGASESRVACAQTGNPARDVYYKFVATSTTHSVTLYPELPADYIMQIFTGSCDSQQPVTGCIDNTGVGEIEGTTLTNLVPGQTYWVRVYTRTGWASLQFKLAVNTGTVIPNDEPAGAIVRATNGSGSTDKFTNIGSTVSLPACSGTTARDIWFKFTATGSSHVVRYGIAGSTTYPLAAQVFSGTLGNLVPLSCYAQADQALQLTGLIPGNTYYYRIYIPNNTASTEFYTYVTTPGVALPVTFTGFRGEKTDHANLLYWTTANELNVAGYEVQVSTNGTNFTSLAYVTAYTNGSASNQYNFRHLADSLNRFAVLYYRIKEIDRDNRFSYSGIVSLRTKPEEPAVTVFPNPVADIIYLNGVAASLTAYQLVDLNGRIVMRGITVNNHIDVSRLNAGMYVLKLNLETQGEKTFLIHKTDK